MAVLTKVEPFSVLSSQFPVLSSQPSPATHGILRRNDQNDTEQAL